MKILNFIVLGMLVLTCQNAYANGTLEYYLLDNKKYLENIDRKKNAVSDYILVNIGLKLGISNKKDILNWARNKKLLLKEVGWGKLKAFGGNVSVFGTAFQEVVFDFDNKEKIKSIKFISIHENNSILEEIDQELRENVDDNYTPSDLFDKYDSRAEGIEVDYLKSYTDSSSTLSLKAWKETKIERAFNTMKADLSLHMGIMLSPEAYEETKENKKKYFSIDCSLK